MRAYILVLLAFASASSITEADLTDAINNFKDAIQDLKNGEGPIDIIQGLIQNHPEIKENIATVLPQLRQIGLEILAGKDPKTIINQVLQANPAIKDKLVQVCSIQLLQNIKFVQQSCNAIQQTNPSAQKRSWSEWASGLYDSAGQLAGNVASGASQWASNVASSAGQAASNVYNSAVSGYKAAIDGFSQMVKSITPHTSVQDLAKQIYNFGENKVLALCHTSVLQSINMFKQYCPIVVPIAEQLAVNRRAGTEVLYVPISVADPVQQVITNTVGAAAGTPAAATSS